MCYGLSSTFLLSDKTVKFGVLNSLPALNVNLTGLKSCAWLWMRFTVSEIDIYFTDMLGDVMYLPFDWSLHFLLQRRRLLSVAAQPLSSSACRRRPSARFQDQPGLPFSPNLTVTIRGISTALTLDQCLEANPSLSLLAHMSPIWNFFLYPLWRCAHKVKGTHLELHSCLITVL